MYLGIKLYIIQKAVASKKFSGLPEHKRLRVRVELWKIDAWDGEELFIKLDDNEIWRQKFGWSDPETYDLCGG